MHIEYTPSEEKVIRTKECFRAITVGKEPICMEVWDTDFVMFLAWDNITMQYSEKAFIERMRLGGLKISQLEEFLKLFKERGQA